MTTRSWVRRLFSRTPGTVRQAPARFRPLLEALEDRLAPATLTVTTLSDATTHTGTSRCSSASTAGRKRQPGAWRDPVRRCERGGRANSLPIQE